MGKLRCKLPLSSEIAKAETIVVDSAVKRKTSEFIVIRFKLISNRAFNRETFFSPSLVALQVAPLLRDCKGRDYRRRFRGQTENEWVYSHQVQVNLK